jgi:hypothetical protein
MDARRKLGALFLHAVSSKKQQQTYGTEDRQVTVIRTARHVQTIVFLVGRQGWREPEDILGGELLRRVVQKPIDC